ncbi:MAG: hypothetical protein AAFR87_21170 [Bacteroidota bacterium]
MGILFFILTILLLIGLERDIIRTKRSSIRPIFVLRRDKESKSYINDGNGPALRFELYKEDGREREILVQAESVLKKESLDFSKLGKGKYMIRYEDANTYVYRDEILIE